MTASQQKAMEDLWPTYGIEFDGNPIDFHSLFDRKAPVVLELGFGNGDSLVELAAGAPELDFIGIEVHEPGIGHCMIAARQANADNLRLICHDGVEVLRDGIPDESLARFNLYFADPWPKKRHHKRRIVQPEFVDLVADKLAQGGDFYIATDWQNYAEHIDEVLEQTDRFSCLERREHEGDQPLDRPRTKFETRGLKRGHKIWDWRFSKVS